MSYARAEIRIGETLSKGNNPQAGLGMQPNMSPPVGYESVIFRVLLHLEAMGTGKPKTVDKLRNALMKWRRVVVMFDPFDVFGKENFQVKVGRPVSIRVTEDVIAKGIQKSVLNSAKGAGSLISVIDQNCPYGLHVASVVQNKLSTVTSNVLDNCPESIHFQEKVDKLVQMLQVNVNGSHRCQSTSLETLVNNLIMTGLKNMQRYNYIVMHINGEVTYNFPSSLLIKAMHNIMVDYQKDLKTAFESDDTLSSWKCCTTINERCERCNMQIDELAHFMNVDDETKKEMLNIFSDALDALHKRKNEPVKPNQFTLFHDKQYTTLTSQHKNELFRRVFASKSSDDSDSSYSYSRSSSRSRSRSRHLSSSSSRSRSRSPSPTTVTSHLRSSPSPSIRRSRSSTPDAQSQSRRLSRSPSNSRPLTCNVRRGSNISSSSSDLQIQRRPRKRSVARSLSPSAKKRKLDKAAAMAKRFSVQQAEVLSDLMGLQLFDRKTPETFEPQKVSEFQKLCDGLKSLSVEDLAKIPDNICLIDLIILDALNKMGDCKPKSVKALVNALRPVCKVIFVLNPKKLVNQSKTKAKPKGKTKQKLYIHLVNLQLSETISLNKGGLFNPTHVPNYICLNFPKEKVARKKGSKPAGISTHEMQTEKTLTMLRKSGLNTWVNVEKSEVYEKLVKVAACRARAISSTVIRPVKEEKGYFVQKFVAWKQTVIKRRSSGEPMESDWDDNSHKDNITSNGMGLDFKNANSLYNELVPLFIMTKELPFEKLLSLLLSTNLLKKTASGDIVYSPEFAGDQWKCDWRSREDALLKSLHFRENDAI